MNQEINIGISESNRSEIANGLSRLLADSYTLYLKTHNFRWNVVGPQFNTLHTMFEAQYSELAIAVDDIAERIRALGVKAPGSYRQFDELTRIEEGTAREVFPIAEEASDEPSADLLTQRMHLHEKTAWMLRSMIA